MKAKSRIEKLEQELQQQRLGENRIIVLHKGQPIPKLLKGQIAFLFQMPEPAPPPSNFQKKIGETPECG